MGTVCHFSLVIVIETELYFQVEPTATANRWSRVEKKRIVVPMPKMIEKYNQKMGGVDLLDAMVAVYRIRIRKRKWWWSIYAWSLSVSAVNVTSRNPRFPTSSFFVKL